MTTGKSQLIGSAGQFYVAYGLSVRGINSAITLGNVPSVDLMGFVFRRKTDYLYSGENIMEWPETQT